MSQCWPSSMTPYGVSRPQGVKPPIIPCLDVLITRANVDPVPWRHMVSLDHKELNHPLSRAWMYWLQSQCWPSSMTPHVVSRPQGVKLPIIPCLDVLITWANVDPVPCRHMVSLDHKELNHPLSRAWMYWLHEPMLTQFHVATWCL